jgi:general secretion pathway protein G
MYGDYPPSRVLLCEDGNYPTGSTQTLAQFYSNAPAGKFGNPDLRVSALAERSVRYLRKFFPRALPPSPANGFWHDFNGNGQLDTIPIYLEGHEALVFFLGGIPVETVSGGNTSIAMTGFGKDPQRPFTTTLLTAPAAVRSDNRKQPFFEFKAERLVDYDVEYGPGTRDFIPSFLDTQGGSPSVSEGNIHFITYFSSYGGNQYDPNDVNFPEESTTRRFRANLNIPSADYTTGPYEVMSAAPNPYTTGAALPNNGFASFVNPNSFQIITAGGDGYFGPGGTYAGEIAGEKLPADPPDSTVDLRSRERDNISNFSRGRLE